VTETRPEREPQPPDLERRVLTPLGYAVAVAIPLVIAAVGIFALFLNYDDEDLVDGQRVPVLTSDWQPGDAGGDSAQLSGVVTLSGGCVTVGETYVVWPRDYEVTVQKVGAGEQVKVYDPDRRIVARGGDTIEAGGGYTDVGEYAGRPCAPASGEVFVVQSDVTVLDQN
jgi:hypothetical protein